MLLNSVTHRPWNHVAWIISEVAIEVSQSSCERALTFHTDQSQCSKEARPRAANKQIFTDSHMIS
jgi:hypothetical protein